MILALFIAVVVIAIIFGMTNGFTNGGGLVATVITTRAMEPMGALILVAVSEVAGLFLMGQAVSVTLAKNMVTLPASASAQQALAVLVAAFLGALIWNTGMWYVALPTSSSHALVGGMAGAVLLQYGPQAVHWPMFVKIFMCLAAAPVAGVLLGIVFARAVYWVGEFLTPSAKGFFRTLEVIGLAGVAIAQGSNDGQKCIAMILMGLVALTGSWEAAASRMDWPLLLLCGGAMALGVMFGSRRIIRTMGKRLYRVSPLQGFCAETATMLLVGMSSYAGYPMSTSQVMSTSVLGAGMAIQPRDVRWKLVGEMGLAWMVTVPAAAFLSAGLVWLFRSFVPGL